ncbi:MAG TPA: SDR family oxidoreductase [Caldimonas sp.]|nr:SDR family oxidoreductase [Caldimonas sp.]HEX2542921.1 SDR family oxidoreductase [Caldimonas sp.]
MVLTGASSGIGHATAIAFARDGADLVLAARGVPALEAVAAACRAIGADVLVHPVDVTDADAVKALAEAAIARFGAIDVWANLVGVGAVGRFEDVPMEVHRRVVETSLVGQMNGAHAVLGHFRSRRRGTLINMVSIGSFAPAPYAASYAATKFALRGFAESLRAELTALPDVRVCNVYPTFVDTPGLSHGANYTGRRLKPPPPLVDPRTVAARVVVALAHAPRATTMVGSIAWPARLAHALAPNLVGTVTAKLMEAALARADPAPVTTGNLFEASRGTAIDAGHRRRRAGPAGLGLLALGAAAWLWSKHGPMPFGPRQ